MSEPTWTGLLLDQLTWHWDHQLRERLEGLTDAEYLWEPVPGCWSVRPRGEGVAAFEVGAGATIIDFDFEPPDPPPVTTIAWRLGHVIVGVLAQRSAGHFDGPKADYDSFEYAATAEGALAQLDAEYERWVRGVAALSEADLHRPAGPAEGPYADLPMGALVLHINREVIHHLAEVSLLRDLYAHREGD